MTRKRHGLPPQPFVFFKNVFDYIISKGYGIVVSALQSNTTIGASVFFHFGKNALYKYGASDMKFQNLRPNNLIMWEAIKWYRNRGNETINFGRTEPYNLGLLRFKRLWGASESPIKYYRYECKKRIIFIRKYRSTRIKQYFLICHLRFFEFLADYSTNISGNVRE